MSVLAGIVDLAHLDDPFQPRDNGRLGHYLTTGILVVREPTSGERAVRSHRFLGPLLSRGLPTWAAELVPAVSNRMALTP